MKRMPAFLILTLITVIAAVLLAVTDQVTREPIAAAATGEADAARKAVLAAAETFSQVVAPQGLDTLYEGLAGGQKVGHAATVTVSGFAGPVEVTLGLDLNNTISAISVGGSSFAETAGLGALAKESAFTDQFKGKTVPITLNVDVDAISGATITSRAVVDGVNTVAQALGVEMSAAVPEPSQEASESAPPSSASDDSRLAAYPGAETFVNGSFTYDVQVGGKTVGKVAMVTVQGFESPIEVTVGVDNSNTLTGISVGGSGFAETPGLGAKAKEPAFTDQFAGKSLPVVLGEGIDAISSATVTSTAVVKGVNEAAQLLGIGGEAAATSSDAAPAAADTAPADDPLKTVYPAAETFVAQTAPEGVAALYEAQAGGITVGHVAVVSQQGFAGPVEVTVGMDLNGVLTGILVGGDAFAETQGFGSKAKEPAFTDQFMGKNVPVTLGDNVDAISGATVTSSAVQNAVNLAAKAMGAAIEFTLVDTQSSATH
ncbi:MAG: FMN-binding protein [Clostridiales bacterium]|nr:FMN-binding protein [Clostridiales bacterium]